MLISTKKADKNLFGIWYAHYSQLMLYVLTSIWTQPEIPGVLLKATSSLIQLSLRFINTRLLFHVLVL